MLKGYPSLSVGSVWQAAVPQENSFGLLSIVLQLKGRLELQVLNKTQMHLAKPVQKQPMSWSGFLVRGKSSVGFGLLLKSYY